MNVVCEQCKTIGYLQQLGNYYRVRHYLGIDQTTRKLKFVYHKQSIGYAQSQVKLNSSSQPKEVELTRPKPMENLTQGLDLNNPNNSLNSKISAKRSSSSWLGHKPSKLAIPGSNPGDRTFLRLLERVSLVIVLFWFERVCFRVPAQLSAPQSSKGKRKLFVKCKAKSQEGKVRRCLEWGIEHSNGSNSGRIQNCFLGLRPEIRTKTGIIQKFS
jgi:hypothetical protein